MERWQKNRLPHVLRCQKGMSITELIVVLLVVAIIVVAALPQIISSRRLFRFSSIQREMTTYVREARQTAISEREQVTFRYDNSVKKITIYGGSLGPFGSANNKTLRLSGMGVSSNDIVYGRPAGVSGAALNDGTNLTVLTGNMIEIAFEPDGSVLDGSDNPIDNATFLYHAIYPTDTAFALSILGTGGRVKVWRYSAGVDAYIE